MNKGEAKRGESTKRKRSKRMKPKVSCFDFKLKFFLSEDQWVGS